MSLGVVYTKNNRKQETSLMLGTYLLPSWLSPGMSALWLGAALGYWDQGPCHAGDETYQLSTQEEMFFSQAG